MAFSMVHDPVQYTDTTPIGLLSVLYGAGWFLHVLYGLYVAAKRE